MIHGGRLETGLVTFGGAYFVSRLDSSSRHVIPKMFF